LLKINDFPKNKLKKEAKMNKPIKEKVGKSLIVTSREYLLRLTMGALVGLLLHWWLIKSYDKTHYWLMPYLIFGAFHLHKKTLDKKWIDVQGVFIGFTARALWQFLVTLFF
jgi:hypothetical protein